MGKQKAKRKRQENEPQPQGNYVDKFVKRMFGQILVFVDFLLNYADQQFISEIDLSRISPAPTHYISHISQEFKEHILDLIFKCPLKDGSGELMAVIIFEHQTKSLKKIPRKLHKYINAVWDAEEMAGQKLSAPYFLVLRTAAKPHRGPLPKMSGLLPKGRDRKPLGKIVEVEYDVVDLPAWDFGKLVGGPVLRLALGVLKAMAGDDTELPKALQPLFEITDEEQLFELTKEVIDFATIALVARGRQVDEAMLCRVLNPIFKGKESIMITTIFEERERKAVAEAEAKNAPKWKAEGAANVVMELLQDKFNKVPKRIENAVRSMVDPTALNSLAVQVTHCQSLKEFEELLP